MNFVKKINNILKDQDLFASQNSILFKTMQNQPVEVRVQEMIIKPRLIKLTPSVQMNQIQTSKIQSNLCQIPKVKKININNNDIQLKLKMFNNYDDNLSYRVNTIIKKQLDPDYCQDVNEVKAKIAQTQDQYKQIGYVIKYIINPVLNKDGGWCEFIDFEKNEQGEQGVKLRFQGACGTCPSSIQTMKNFIEKIVKQCMPEISYIVKI